MDTLTSYIKRFSNLHINKSNGQVAPHKAILLLSVIELFENGHYADNRITPDGLLELTFNKTWAKYVNENSTFKCSLAYPFFHMEFEGFWQLVESSEFTKQSEYSSVTSIRKNFESAIIDDNLVILLKNQESRNKLRDVLVSSYIDSTQSFGDNNTSGMSQASGDITIDHIINFVKSLEIKAKDQQSTIETLLKEINESARDINLLKSELASKDIAFANLTKQFIAELETKKAEINRLAGIIKEKNQEISLLKEQLELQNSPSQVHTDLCQFPFFSRISADELPDLPTDFRSIKYVYSPQSEEYYKIDHDRLHADEHLLSTLRVKIYEQLQSTPEIPLLRCACCKRPVVLAGNSGIKGEIIGFRHLGDGNIFTGEHIGKNTSLPKEESFDELSKLEELFINLKPVLENFKVHKSFLLLPGTVRDYPGDITFDYRGKSVAVIFASAGHPLDFIVRRNKLAYESGFIPLWILSPSHFSAKVMSNRDISVFSNGYLCTIDEDTVNLYKESGYISLYIREFHNNEYAFLSLSRIINDAERAILNLIDTPLWIGENSDGTIKETKIEHKGNINQAPIEETEKPKKVAPRYKYSVIDYWMGKRHRIKGSLCIDKIGGTYGILDMSTQRYPALPIYKDIRISEDKTEAELINLDGSIQTIKI